MSDEKKTLTLSASDNYGQQVDGWNAVAIAACPDHGMGVVIIFDPAKHPAKSGSHVQDLAGLRCLLDSEKTAMQGVFGIPAMVAVLAASIMERGEELGLTKRPPSGGNGGTGH